VTTSPLADAAGAWTTPAALTWAALGLGSWETLTSSVDLDSNPAALEYCGDANLAYPAFDASSASPQCWGADASQRDSWVGAVTAPAFGQVECTAPSYDATVVVSAGGETSASGYTVEARGSTEGTKDDFFGPFCATGSGTYHLYVYASAPATYYVRVYSNSDGCDPEKSKGNKAAGTAALIIILVLVSCCCLAFIAFGIGVCCLGMAGIGLCCQAAFCPKKRKQQQTGIQMATNANGLVPMHGTQPQQPQYGQQPQYAQTNYTTQPQQGQYGLSPPQDGQQPQYGQPPLQGQVLQGHVLQGQVIHGQVMHEK
ncbi:hypothetical protein M885DRAFT_506877, partial [Pelagophyceae sp. CCMP2097]